MAKVLASIAELISLSLNAVVLMALAAFAAGMVRGFAGFGLSAVMMASVATFIPPVSLIPVCFMLEAMASLVMFRGGMKEADMHIVWGLVIGSAVGTPIGLYMTNSIDAELSKTFALAIITSLALLQLLKLKPRFLMSHSGLYISGLTAGVATGLASVGGMVVALYVLASDAEPKRMRASLVMFLFLGMFSSTVYLFLYDMLTTAALMRAVVLAPLMLLGLLLGSQLFRPQWQRAYKPACLVFLLVLCAVGLSRQLWGAD